MPICGLFWAIGGAAGGSKLFRRIGVPLVTCLTIYAFDKFHPWSVFFAIPFMVWIAPSYGIDSWLFKLFSKVTKEPNFPTRLVTYIWYWYAIGVAIQFENIYIYISNVFNILTLSLDKLI